MKNDFKNKSQSQPQSEVWYDLEYDKILIEQSIAKQYHILPSEQGEMHYRDWILLIGGLMEDTPLGKTVQIRREDNKDMLNNYTKSEHRMRNEWREFRANQKKQTASPEDARKAINELEMMFANMFGGGN